MKGGEKRTGQEKSESGKKKEEKDMRDGKGEGVQQEER